MKALLAIAANRAAAAGPAIDATLRAIALAGGFWIITRALATLAAPSVGLG